MSNDTLVNTVRAEALALAPLSIRESRPDFSAVEHAISWAMLTYGGPDGCAAALAQEFGEHPELIAPRMRQACAVIALLYGGAVRDGA